MLRPQLRRAGVGEEVVVSGVDGEYDETLGLWQPHLHLVASVPARPAARPRARKVRHALRRRPPRIEFGLLPWEWKRLPAVFPSCTRGHVALVAREQAEASYWRRAHRVYFGRRGLFADDVPP